MSGVAAGPMFVLGLVALALFGVIAACVAASEADDREDDLRRAAAQERAARAVLYDHSPPSIDVGRTTDPRAAAPASLASPVGRAPDADRRSGLGMKVRPCEDGYVWEVLHNGVVVAEGIADSQSEAAGEARRVIRRGGVTV